MPAHQSRVKIQSYVKEKFINSPAKIVDLITQQQLSVNFDIYFTEKGF